MRVWIVFYLGPHLHFVLFFSHKNAFEKQRKRKNIDNKE